MKCREFLSGKAFSGSLFVGSSFSSSKSRLIQRVSEYFEGWAPAVVDSKFRVRNVKGLRVVDASVFPDIPGFFIATSIYLIAEKAAEDILTNSDL